METLTRAEAHHMVSTAETDGTLALLAEHWNFAGCWNEGAEWDVDSFHEFVDDCADMDGDQRDNGASEHDDTGLPPWNG
jgi:hypothetical protein